MGLVRIGDVEDLVDTAYSGFDYPANRTELLLLENEEGSSGNVVIQEGSLPYRRATVTVIAESLADRDTLRGYKDAGDDIEFVDSDGLLRSVSIFSCSSSKRDAETWEVTFVLLELTDPAPEGS